MGDKKESNGSKKPAAEVSQSVKVVKLNAVVSGLIGLTLGSVLGGPWMCQVMELIRGYRWDYKNRCIMESPNPDGYGMDFCRIPADCEQCRDVRKIDEIHVDDLSIEMFQKKYAYSNRPLVVRNATLHWKAMKELDYFWLKDEYLRDAEVLEYQHDDCWFNPYTTKEFRNLAAVFRLPEHRLLPENFDNPWYVGWRACQPSVEQALFTLFERPAFINPDSTPPIKPWIFIGTPGPGAHIHIDNVDMSSWQAQIRGHKKWYLSPPSECSWTCGSTMETVVNPGDIIVLNTNFWFHSTQIVGSELSLVMTIEYD